MALLAYVSPLVNLTLVSRFRTFTEGIGTCVQEDRLWVADPKAINHILQKSGYLYAKPNNIREGSALTSGRGILWAEGKFYIVTSPFFRPC